MATKKIWQISGGLILLGGIILLVGFALSGFDWQMFHQGSEHWYRTFQF